MNETSSTKSPCGGGEDSHLISRTCATRCNIFIHSRASRDSISLFTTRWLERDCISEHHIASRSKAFLNICELFLSESILKNRFRDLNEISSLKASFLVRPHCPLSFLTIFTLSPIQLSRTTKRKNEPKRSESHLQLAKGHEKHSQLLHPGAC